MFFVPFAQSLIVGFRFKEHAADSCYFCHSRLLSPFIFFTGKVNSRSKCGWASLVQPHASTVAGFPPACGFIFFLRINAETRVIINPTGNGSAKVIAALMKGLSKYFN